MRYFDKTFWKMFSGFITLLAISLAVIVGVRVYEHQHIPVNTDNIAHIGE